MVEVASNRKPSADLSPVSRAARATRLGVLRETLTCWEYSSVTICAEGHNQSLSTPQGASADGVGTPIVTVMSAFFGDLDDRAGGCADITMEVQTMVLEDIVSQGDAFKVDVPASTRLWGDPARFRVKKLEVTYEYQWLSNEEQAALEALEYRVTAKAQAAPDLDTLLERLGRSLHAAASPAGAASSADAPPLGCTSPRWKSLGFQSNNPRTDLRTGRLALECLVYFAEHYPEAANRIAREAQVGGLDYPFAVASINVTHHLARFFGLACEEEAVGAPRHVLKRFATFLVDAAPSAVDPFAEVHVAAMQRLHLAWSKRKATNPLLTVMDFEPCIRELMVAVEDFCSSSPLASVSEFRGFASGQEGHLERDPRQVSDDGFDGMRDSAAQVVTSVSQTAGFFGTYLQDMLGEAAAAVGAAASTDTGGPAPIVS